jgi:hypothetical protein
VNLIIVDVLESAKFDSWKLLPRKLPYISAITNSLALNSYADKDITNRVEHILERSLAAHTNYPEQVVSISDLSIDLIVNWMAVPGFTFLVSSLKI